MILEKRKFSTEIKRNVCYTIMTETSEVRAKPLNMHAISNMHVALQERLSTFMYRSIPTPISENFC